MLKTVSSVANALGALNYQGTWNASTNTPTLASGVGTQGDYYVVSVSGATDLDGITNWGVGDWAAFNGSVWQRVEGGADGNFVNLDVTGTTTLNGATLATGDLEVSAGGLSLDKSDNAAVTVKRGGTTVAMLGDTGSGNAGDLLLWNSSGGLTTNITGRAVDSYINSGGGLAIATTTASGFKLRVSGTAKIENDLTVTGDVIIATSGNGIDFSATAGTGTSELFDDYEEGDWTPTLQATDGAFNSVTYDTLTGGKYTKIGNVVHIQCYMRTDALDNTVGRSGDVVIEGLPFASVTASTGINGHSAFSVGITSAFAGENPSMSFVGGGGQTGMQLMYQTAADGNTSNLKPSDLGTGVNSNIVLISGTYTSA